MTTSVVDRIIAGKIPLRMFEKGLTGTMVAGRPHSLRYLAGNPPAAAAPTPGIGGEVLTTYAGQLPFTNPTSGLISRLTKLAGSCNIAGSIQLIDILWQNSGIDPTLTTEQIFTSSAQIPARDWNGSNSGYGIQAGVEVSTVTGLGTPTLTLKYTDELGNAGSIATNQIATVASSIAGTFYPIGLAAGDQGIQKAQSLTLSATWTSGVIHVILYRVLATLPVTAANVWSMLDVLAGAGQQLWDNTVPFLIFRPSATTSSNISGEVEWSQYSAT